VPSAVKEAVTVVVPAETPFTVPIVDSIVAMEESSIDQVIVESLYAAGVIVAVKSMVLSTFTEAGFGAMLIDGLEETVTVQVAVTSPYAAVIVAVPSATPVTTPPGPTSATSDLSVVQVRSLALIQLGVISSEIVALSPVATAVLASSIFDTGLKFVELT